MPTFWHFLLEFVMLITLAVLLGMLFERFKLSAILGYLMAGVLLGPGGLKFVEPETVEQISELGVALLLFTIGLEFSFRRLKQLGAASLGGGVLQIIVTGVCVALGCTVLGLSPREAVIIGCMIPLSSTACVLRLLADRAELDSVHGRNCLGILLLQDIAVVPLVLLVAAMVGGGGIGSIFLGMGKALLLGAALVGVFIVICNYILPIFFDVAAMTKNRDLPILLAIVTCVAATWSAHSLGLSAALGAFVAGMLLAESPFSTQIRSDLASLRALFVTLFFTSIGLLAKLEWIPIYWQMLLWLVPVVIILNTAIVWGVLRMFRVPHRHALATGLCLAQIGEFSFLLATLGLKGGVLKDTTFQPTILTIFATLFLTPFLVRIAPHVGKWVEEKIFNRGRNVVLPDGEAHGHSMEGHVIVVGYGPAGRGVIDALGAMDVPALVLDLNPRGVDEAHKKGLVAHLGDASQADVLEHAHISEAMAIVVALPDHKATLQVIHQVRTTAPQVMCIVRSRYHMYAKDLENAGAQVVLDEEVEVGRGLAAAVIQLALPSPPIQEV